MRVGVVGDLHGFAQHPGYMDFVFDTLIGKLNVDTWVFIGDLMDLAGPSKHRKYPGYPGPDTEMEWTIEAITPWYTTVGSEDVYACVGNHDERSVLAALDVGIPAKALAPYSDVLETPGWQWAQDITIDGVFYTHGTRRGGLNPALNVVRKGLGLSCVLGHNHSRAGVHWLAGHNQRLFGLDVGCGADERHPAMWYARDNTEKWLIGCGAVLDGAPHHFMMPCGRGEPYHRSNFERMRGMR